MSRTIFVTLCFLVQIQGVAQPISKNQFVLRGKVTDAKPPFIFLKFKDKDGNRVYDSCRLNHGEFSFTGTLFEPCHAILRTNSQVMADNENSNIVEVFLEPGTMTATLRQDHFRDLILAGSKAHVEFESLLRQYALVDKLSDSLSEKYSNVDYQFISSHPDSYVSAYDLETRAATWKKSTVKALYDKLLPAIQDCYYGKKIKDVIDRIENSSEGKTAKEFKTTDIAGKSLCLSDFKGRYVLLDFWASWCGPCRAGTPHLKELYAKCHPLGLDIIGIAEDDDQPNAWKQAVDKDGTSIWYNVLSGQRFNADETLDNSKAITKAYGIVVFPTKILIDKSGVIIGRYSGTDEEPLLDGKLNELFP